MPRFSAWMSAALLAPSLMAVSHPTALAAPQGAACRITDFAPRATAAGLQPKTVNFTIHTAGCAVNAWSLAVQRQPIASQLSSKVPLRPADMDNTDAGPYDISVWVQDTKGHAALRDFPHGFRILRQTAWGSTTVTTATTRPGSTARLTTRLARVDWDKHRYTGYPRATAQLQFADAKTPGTWRTLRSVRSTSTGRMVTTFRPTTTGQWRLVYRGDATHARSTSPIQTITVRPGLSSDSVSGSL